MDRDLRKPIEAPPPVSAPSAMATTMPGRHGGTLRRGNPGNKGGKGTPSWIREQLRRGLAQALPAIKHALRTGEDLRTGARLSWTDFTKVVEVASRISMPAQSELGATDGEGIVVQLLVGPEPTKEPPIEEPPVGLLPRVASAAPAEAPIARVAPPPRRSPFGPGVG